MNKVILAIESSCDETSVAIIDLNGNILNEITKTQIDLHKIYGGVVPEIASRSHLAEIQNILETILKNIKKEDIVAVAATGGPGLIGGLIVGVMVAKGIAISLNIPFIAVNHLRGHALSSKIENKSFEYPFLLLLISGGHCQILSAKSFDDYQILGKTIDDSVGEAFDKVARMLGFDYPGGIFIQQEAIKGDKYKYKFKIPMTSGNNPDFSFSGLKTNVLHTIQKIEKLTTQNISDIAASFQYTVAKTIEKKLEIAIEKYKQYSFEGKNKLGVCGGVAANIEIRETLQQLCLKHDFELFIPSIKYCTDNASMIAIAALEAYNNKQFNTFDFEPKSQWRLF